LYSFLRAMQSLYKANPYHNSVHAAQVAHSCACLSKMVNIWSDMRDVEKCCFLIAALGHDVGHPGFTNDFLVNSSQELALTYNDFSVLENFHASLIFQILRRPRHNIFMGIKGRRWLYVRKSIVDLVLATDMRNHSANLAAFRLRTACSSYSRKREDDRGLIRRLIIKAADVGYPSLEWPQYLEWTERIYEEFHKQGDVEYRHGMTISFLCDRAQHRTPWWCQVQSNFLKSIVLPMFVLLRNVQHLHRNFEDGHGGAQHQGQAIERGCEQSLNTSIVARSFTKCYSNDGSLNTPLLNQNMSIVSDGPSYLDRVIRDPVCHPYEARNLQDLCDRIKENAGAIARCKLSNFMNTSISFP